MSRSLISNIHSIFPFLNSNAIKGQNGRIGVIGGSYEFTGAPFYSAVSALKIGGDLAHVFCSKSSSISIKAYCPEIIVHPIFVSEEEVKLKKSDRKKIIQEWVNKIITWEKAIDVWVIGPGLGRDHYMQEFFPLFVKSIGKEKKVIFDADGIYYLSQTPELFDAIKGHRAILTPNHRELGFIKPYLNIDLEKNFKIYKIMEEIQQLPSEYNNIHGFSLLVKGEEDIILGPSSYAVRIEGGKKRCGGIGDILAGVTGICSFWNFQYGPVLGSKIVKIATRRAFEKEGRSLTAPFIIQELPRVVKDIEQGKL